jgi:L-seryl-tRNA(Ser) seleniumtransferase
MMKVDPKLQELLRMLPGVDHILELAKIEPFFANIPPTVTVKSIRAVIETQRILILQGDPDVSENDLADAGILEMVKALAKKAMRPNLRYVVNATGIVVHTNLGRSLLAIKAVENLGAIAGRYSNLEYDLQAGRRGSRYSQVEDLLCEISGAEAAMVVNNNAAAVLLCLETIAKNRAVIVSRGELVEIGGSFRIPDVMAKSGCILKEIGTTNRTHLRDYETAVAEATALFLKVHRSNYSIVGFTAEVSLQELVDLGTKYGIPVMEDLGSGTFVDFSAYGLLKEPTVQDSVATGADVITFSGDKLLGGPQAGVILGKKDILDEIKKNPLTRALRIDKLTLAALESTLRLYRDEAKAIQEIPTLRMLTAPLNEIEKKAARLVAGLDQHKDPRLETKLIRLSSKAGGGALPLLELPSQCVGIKIQGLSVNSFEKSLRQNDPPIIGRIEEDYIIMDPRTVQEDEIAIIAAAIENILKRASK